MITVTQNLDCAQSLTDATAPSNPVLTYDFASPTESLGDWTTFFVNSDTANCPIVECALKLPGCSTAYTSGELSISGTDPFTLTANKNVVAGWTETVCIECHNGALFDLGTFDNFVVTQIRDCGTAITQKPVPPTDASVVFNLGVTTEAVS